MSNQAETLRERVAQTVGQMVEKEAGPKLVPIMSDLTDLLLQIEERTSALRKEADRIERHADQETARSWGRLVAVLVIVLGAALTGGGIGGVMVVAQARHIPLWTALAWILSGHS